MEAAMKSFATQVDSTVDAFARDVAHPELRADLESLMRHQLAVETELTPYKFHVSEDIYTSIVLHSDPDRKWKSVLHPAIESKMLSPLDLQSWIVQRFKYAGGTIDIGIHDNPIFQRGMEPRKKLMYAMTFWSYLSPLWNVIFLSAPIIALFTGIAPVSAYSSDFFLHLLPFLLLHEAASMAGMWGVENFQGRSLNLAFFSINLRAIWTVLKGEKIKFPVTPKERQDGRFLHLVIPQLTVAGLTALAIFYGGIKAYVNADAELTGMWVVNTFWGLNNILAMSALIRAAIWVPPEDVDRSLQVNNGIQEVKVA
jgi:cellulose synthase (UDP-forming)